MASINKPVTGGFRLIIRGTNKAGERKRRVATVHTTYEGAWKEFDSRISDLSSGLEDVFCNVFEPVGLVYGPVKPASSGSDVSDIL